MIVETGFLYIPLEPSSTDGEDIARLLCVVEHQPTEEAVTADIF